MQQQLQSEDNFSSLNNNLQNVEKPIVRIDSKFASDSVTDLIPETKK
jgi:mitofusin